jgi:hypothetical protein
MEPGDADGAAEAPAAAAGEVQRDEERHFAEGEGDEAVQDEEEGEAGLLDELLGGVSDDEYDPEEDALAQETAVGAQQGGQAVGDAGGSTGRNGDLQDGEAQAPRTRARDDGGVGVDRTHWSAGPPDGQRAREGDRRSSDAGYVRERRARESEGAGARGNELSHPGSNSKGPRHFQHRALVVGNEGSGTAWLDKSALYRHFSKFGPVVDVFMPRNNKALVAFVEFETDQQLQRALDAQQHFVSNCSVRVKRAEQVSLFLPCGSSRARSIEKRTKSALPPPLPNVFLSSLTSHSIPATSSGLPIWEPPKPRYNRRADSGARGTGRLSATTRRCGGGSVPCGRTFAGATCARIAIAADGTGSGRGSECGRRSESDPETGARRSGTVSAIAGMRAPGTQDESAGKTAAWAESVGRAWGGTMERTGAAAPSARLCFALQTRWGLPGG